ncbi:hypothetical protein PV10_04970 [Exophiala mesophila]|uniref:Uncharacterized protein n=1 Tax=Exophiala mesophila TaxID=212818 RepID=A0A0D1ZGH2_EXOME|nr:uncharacterized protein PV10_04970 [Exophiala mesophila]KIV93782.1 hypothetical protein PV10_04970 [Exophiala mesophila]
MSESPAKRRRLNSSEPGVTVDPLSNPPITPTRASYRSPTKSSLARSHPHLVSKSPRRPTTGSKGKLLRDEILSRRSEPRGAPTPVRQDDVNVTNRKTNATLATDAGVPPALSTTTAPSLSGPQAAVTRSSAPPEHNPQDTLPKKAKLSTSLHLKRQIMEPTLVQKPRPRSPSRGRSNEPDLPPTPVQLGLSPAPERPRGLASSSSPRGSKGGSGKHRRRVRGSDHNNSSPLKQKAPSPVNDDEPVEALESEQYSVAEIPHTVVEPDSQPDASDLSQNAKIKERLRQSLLVSIEQVQNEINELEDAIDQDDLDDKTLSRLAPIILESTDARLDIENLSRLNEKSLLEHLTLFAPGGLRIDLTTKPERHEGRAKMIHHLEVKPPIPWPEHIFHCRFRITMDPEDKRVEGIQLVDTSRRTGIYKWIRGRLSNDLHCLDISGLVWGMGQWFSEAVVRAKVFQQLQSAQDQDDSSVLTDFAQDPAVLTEKHACVLGTHLHSTKIAIDVNTDESKKKPRKVLLNWDIDIDWAGQQTSAIDIAVRGVSQKAEAGLKTVFGSLLRPAGVLSALAEVQKMLSGSIEDELETKSLSKPKGGKRKRVA